MNHRKEYVFSLGGQRGTSLFDYKKREIPLKTSLFSEQQKRFNAGFACERHFTPTWVRKKIFILKRSLYEKTFNFINISNV
jgi:hypothetical protein